MMTLDMLTIVDSIIKRIRRAYMVTQRQREYVHGPRVAFVSQP